MHFGAVGDRTDGAYQRSVGIARDVEIDAGCVLAGRRRPNPGVLHDHALSGGRYGGNRTRDKKRYQRAVYVVINELHHRFLSIGITFLRKAPIFFQFDPPCASEKTL
jgi:hypothetical protein